VELAPGDFHLFGLLKKHLGGHICQTDVEVQEAVSKWFCSQNYLVHAAGRHSLKTLFDACVNPFRVTMNKMVPNKQIYTVYSYFPINPLIVSCGPGYLSRYSHSLCAGRSGDRIPVGSRFSAPVQTSQTSPGAHAASYTVSLFPEHKTAGRGVNQHPHLAPRLKNEQSYISTPPLALQELF
jgi:hypothetical protein